MKMNRRIIYSILIILSLALMFVPLARFEDHTLVSLMEDIT